MTDLLCPRCSTPSHPVAMRTRGEVRSRVWRCGCPVRPDVVRPCNLVSRPNAEGYDRGWYATGCGVDPEETEHPTEAGAIAAWRVALERRQREDDEAWANPTPVRAPWRLSWTDAEGDHTATIDGSELAQHVATEMERLMLDREREALATLPTRTDDEVRQVAAACTEATHPETLVAVANECARRWNDLVPEACGYPTWGGLGWHFDLQPQGVYLREREPLWHLARWVDGRPADERTTTTLWDAVRWFGRQASDAAPGERAGVSSRTGRGV